MASIKAVDPNHEIMLESMRRQARSSLVLRRHDDLRKECEKEMSCYDRAKRLMAADCRRSQIQHLNRLKTLLHYSSRQAERRQQSRAFSARHDVRASPFDDASITAALSRSRTLTQNSSCDASGIHVDSIRGVRPGGSASGTGRRRVRSAPTSAHSCMTSASSSSFFTGRERFLFRVLDRDGKEVYIRDESEARESRRQLNGISCDCLSRPSSVSVQRTRNGHPR